MSIRIGKRFWSFAQVAGRQFFGKDEHLTIAHHDTASVAVTDTIPIADQYEAVAITAIELYEESKQEELRERAKFLRDAGLEFTIPSDGPLQGLPILRDVRWKRDERAQGRDDDPPEPLRKPA